MPLEPGCPIEMPAVLLHEVGDGESEAFELHKAVAVDRKLVVFETYGLDARAPAVGETYTFQWMWTPAQLETARSDPSEWTRQEFAPSDAISAAINSVDDLPGTLKTLPSDAGLSVPASLWHKRLPGEEPAPGSTVMPGGWDHEHCELCWEKIALYEGCRRFGYRNGEDWVCEECYVKYIASGLGRRIG